MIRAQENPNGDYNRFLQIFETVIHAPPQLFAKCSPMICLIKVETDETKNVIDIHLSDSADSSLNSEFEKDKNRLDIRSLENYFKRVYKNNPCQTFLIPLSYSMLQATCPDRSVDIATIYNYWKFEGSYLNKQAIILAPIYRQFTFNR